MMMRDGMTAMTTMVMGIGLVMAMNRMDWPARHGAIMIALVVHRALRRRNLRLAGAWRGSATS
jgi:hypothetical protein